MLKTAASHQTSAASRANDLSTPGSSDIHDVIEIDRQTFFRDAGLVRLYREYAAGRHALCLSDEQRAALAGLLDHEFADNVCHQVVAEAADRIELLRFQVGDAGVSDYLSEFFAKSHLEDLSGEAHYTALRDGNHAVSLGWDQSDPTDPKTGRVTIRHEPWWDGRTGVFVAYDAAGNPLYAVKDFDTPEGFRRVVWFEDRVERYIKQSGGALWEPFTYGGENSHVMAWEKADGSPLHIPVIHLANAGRAGGRDGKDFWYGTSELDGGVLGFQDQLNDLQWDISGAARMTGFQTAFKTGGSGLAIDAQGNPIPMTIAPGAFLYDGDANTRFGVLPAGDIGQLIETYTLKLRSVSRMTRTPLHAITGGDWPSGEALLRSELPSINKARRQIKKLAPAWQTVAHRACEIANTFGKAGLNEDALIDAVFAPPDQRDEYQQAQIVSLVAGHISSRERMRKLGYTEDKIDAIMKEKADDDARILAKQAAEAAAGAVVNDTTRTSVPE